MSKKETNTRPASFLQRLQRKTTWVVYYRLHYVPRSVVEEIYPSMRTLELLEQYNSIVKELKESILANYESNRTTVLNTRKRKS